MSVFALSVFLSAFLLFLVQPMIGKYILPWFGSTPGVWTVCLLFFQILLLAGYAYAHLIVSRLKPRTQAWTHIILLGLALLTMPITPAESLKPGPGGNPVLQILTLLLLTVGAPFLLLSATGPLLQGWFARVHPGRSPYRLYALSNLGSLLALLSYPFLFERLLRLKHQTWGWSAGWLACSVLVAMCAFKLNRTKADRPSTGTGTGAADEAAPKPGLGVIALWVALSACGSGLLMATTNRLCLDVAVFPFLSVLPLSLYLLTFIIAFDHDRWYARWIFVMLLPVTMFLAVLGLLQGPDLGVVLQILIGAFTLFVCCMCCHGELVRRKPDPKYLTLFYLAVAGGGAVGGLFVAVVAPAIFSSLFEYHILLVVTYLLVLGLVIRELHASRRLVTGGRGERIRGWATWVGFVGSVIALTAVFLSASSWPGHQMSPESMAGFMSLVHNSRFLILLLPMVVLLVIGGGKIWSRQFLSGWRTAQRAAVLIFIAAAAVSVVPLLGGLTFETVRSSSLVVDQDRNFYGMLSVKEYAKGQPTHEYSLIHGRIFHGHQSRIPERRAWPTTYYGPRSGVGVALRFHPLREKPGRQFRIGVVGLGTGTIAAFANARVLPEFEEAPYVSVERNTPSDYLAFYEINPMVIDWAGKYFSYLADARERGAEVPVFQGDARIVMERQIESGDLQRFDVLAIDAFSGDAIPVHLLTRECFKVYGQHLDQQGILAIHISNRHFELSSVVRRLASQAGLAAVFVMDKSDKDRGVSRSDWILLTKNVDFLNDVGLQKAKDEWPITGAVWTDDYSSIFSIMR